MIRPTLAFLLLMPAAIQAQFVSGVVVDANGARVGSANVRLLRRDGRLILGMVADSSGRFRMPVPTGDSVRIAFERIGYKPVSSRLFILVAAQQMDVEVRLAFEAVPLTPVKVVGKKVVDSRLSEFYSRAASAQRSGMGRIWTREELEQRQPTFLSHLLRTLPMRDAAGCGGNIVYLDRMVVFDDRYGPQFDWSDLDMLVSPEDTEGMEMYRSPNIPFGYDLTLCSITLIWRKPYDQTHSAFTWAKLFAGAGLVGLFVAQQLLFNGLR